MSSRSSGLRRFWRAWRTWGSLVALVCGCLIVLALLSPAGAQQSGMIAGTVSNHSGWGFGTATVVAISQDGTHDYRGSIQQDGTFSLPVPAGTYTVAVRTSGRTGAFAVHPGVTVGRGASTTVQATVPDGAEAAAAGSIEARVAFANGKPAAGVGILGPGDTHVTGQDGSWHADAVHPGVYEVTFFYDGAERATRYLAIGPGTSGRVTLRLPAAVKAVPGSHGQNAGLVGTARYDRGLYIHYCPGSPIRHADVARSTPLARAAHTDWTGWPPHECLKMDKNNHNPRAKYTIVGLNGVHNWLLAGWNNATIIGGNDGDVIWADYRPEGAYYHVAYIHGGNGRNFIYADDNVNHVWTGTNPRTVVHAHNSGTSGIIHCENPRQIVYLGVVSERHYKLYGCHRISHFSVGY